MKENKVVIFGDFRADNTVTSLGLKAGLTSCSEGNDSMRERERPENDIIPHTLLAGLATYVWYGKEVMKLSM